MARSTRGTIASLPGAIDLNDVAAFVAVVDAGGFSHAARRLGVPKSSVSRRVSRLEEHLGVRLLQRLTRAVTLTEEGRDYHARAERALRDLHDASAVAADQNTLPRGTVRVSAPPDVGSEVLPALVAAFVAQHPEVRVEVEMSARAPDLVEGGYDIALRAGEQRDLSVMTRKLQEVVFGLYAAPSFLKVHGTPESPSDLARMSCVLYRPQNGRCTWNLRGPDGEVEVVVEGCVGSDDLTFVRRAAIAGAGVAFLPDLVANLPISLGELAPVLPNFSGQGPSLFLVFPSSSQLSLKVRVLLDFLIEYFPQQRPRSMED